jgi:GNAT superfamily N-acetyltransferase
MIPSRCVPQLTAVLLPLRQGRYGSYITAIWVDDQVQRAFHARAFNPGRWQIITAGRADIGILDIEYRPGEIYISRIEIHPDYQGQGIGTLLISALADEARRKGQDLVLDVLTVNRRAQALYQRLGLKEVTRHGDNNTKITMRLTHSPPKPRRAPGTQAMTNAHDDRSSHQDPGRPPR